MKIKYEKGFTLIELMVVIAIIGVLTSIIISSLNSSRLKANDTKVKAQLAKVRSHAALYADGNNNNYTASVMATPLLPCTGVMFTDSPSGMNDYTGTASAWPAGTLLSCQATAGAYAVSANLQQTGLPAASDTWCVDSVGNSKAIALQLISGDVSCD